METGPGPGGRSVRPPPKAGPAARRIEDAGDVADVIALLRINYDRIVARYGLPAGDGEPGRGAQPRQPDTELVAEDAPADVGDVDGAAATCGPASRQSRWRPWTATAGGPASTSRARCAPAVDGATPASPAGTLAASARPSPSASSIRARARSPRTEPSA
ncbi:MAG: hypothetical protein QOF04_3079, partial [Solirubrobacteraceae bacterium]|nr:hypothetical protein [Solirubrobacteraceae bacterium]